MDSPLRAAKLTKMALGSPNAFFKIVNEYVPQFGIAAARSERLDIGISGMLRVVPEDRPLQLRAYQ